MTDATQHHHCTVPWWRRPPVLLVGIVVLALAIFTIYEVAGVPAATPYGTFLDQLEAGNVASVRFQGTQIIGTFKHPVDAPATNNATQVNTFRTRMPDFGDPTLIAELRQRHVAIDVTSSSSWTRLLAGIPLPMLFFLGFIIVAIVIRFVRGGKAPSTTPMPMHPMQGMIGLVSGLFGKQGQPANPPTSDGSGPKSD
jgi:ATP-dependent Zn protease